MFDSLKELKNGTTRQNPYFKKEVLRLKRIGWNTEAAFCHLLDLTGDPIEALLQYGKEKGFID